MPLQLLNERYETLKQLTRRAGRQTLLAHDRKAEELVVIKLLTFNRDFDWQHLKLFEREIQVLQNLSHQAIPRYLDYFELKGSKTKGFALVQTYLDAPSLEEHLKAGRTFTEEEIKQLAKSVLDILNYLHSRQPPVLHRDIKPSNILLGDRSDCSIGQVYLVDFGSVQTLAASGRGTITIVGTYGYMPPEQFGGRAVPASDLYSLGATLIYLATKKHPAELPQKDLRLQFEKLAKMSSALTKWLKQITEPSQEQRFASAKCALQALNRLSLRTVPRTIRRYPSGDKLTVNVEAIEIVLPPSIVKLSQISITLLALVLVLSWDAVLLAVTRDIFISIFSVPSLYAFFGGFLFGSCLLPFWWFSLYLTIEALLATFGYRKLRIDCQQISSKVNLLGFKFNYPSSAPREAISKLECEAESKKITIWAGKYKYELSRLSKEELVDIARELSLWLELPIQRG